MNGTLPAQSSSSAATIEFEQVSKNYDPAASGPEVGGAVEELSLIVPAGRICVLVGPSGCGKTTTLKMVNRLIEPTSGRILIDGEDIARRDVTELRRGIGYVIQQVGLFPHQTIGVNVATVPRLLGWSADRQRQRADELLALVGLEPDSYRDRYPSQLSGGERQRVGVARALAADPPIMLMDEPFGAVDPIVRERLQNEFLRLQEDLAKTILFVTHDIDEAIKLGDLVVVMRQGGKIAQAGPPAELLAEPASEYVARFVGTDRGLKRLSLFRVADLDLEQPETARLGESSAAVRARLGDQAADYVLLLDDDGRPAGWCSASDLSGDGLLDADSADPTSPLLDLKSTLKDATSLLLGHEVRVGVVVDGRGRAIGVVSLDSIMAFLSDERSGRADGSDAARVEDSISETADTVPAGPTRR